MDSLTVYGADWCGDCRRAKRLLAALRVPFEWVDVAADEEATRQAKAISGRSKIPVIVFPDGSHLVEPGDHELAAAVGAAGLHDRMN